MTYAPVYESETVSRALAQAERRLIEAKNKLREAKGLAPIGAPEPKIVAASESIPAGAIPATPPEHWKLKPTSIRCYTTLLALAPMSLDQLGQHIYGMSWGPTRKSALQVHLSWARQAALRAGIIIPGQNRVTGLIHRIHLKGAST